MGKNRGLTSAAVNHPALRRRSEEPHTRIHIIHITDLFILYVFIHIEVDVLTKGNKC